MADRAVVLLSGGLDSTTAAALARREGWELYALTLRYGQRHSAEIEAARRVAGALGCVKHLELDVDLGALGGSALTGDGSVPKDRPLESGDIPSTYVPARNTVFLSLALAWAEVLAARHIVIGVNALDYSGYPDCRPEYIAAFDYLAGLATRVGVEGRAPRIWAPLQHLTKAGIVRVGLELGLDYGLTHSCYDPLPDGRPCGRCDSCRLRAKGFEEAGTPDPLTDLSSHSPIHPLTMSTHRLYYTDPLLTAFDATVVSSQSAEGRTEVILDQTAFYPTSGGQPHDLGTLGGVTVLDVIDRDDGEIAHVVDGAPVVGARVHGVIDWARRLDHMQQHTGQHILSAAFDRLFRVRTVSFHLGGETSTIDLAREVTTAEMVEAESAANDVVWQDREVGIRFATEEEASRLPLRKEPTRTGTLRLIDVFEFDVSACGGTHVPRAGMVGVIAVVASERFKGATRLTFACGRRALRSHRQLRDVVLAATRVVSVTPGELAPAIERMQAEVKALGRVIREQQERLAGYRAAEMRAAAPILGGLRIVLHEERGADAAALKVLAAAIVTDPGVAVVLVGDGQPAPVIVARSADVAIDAGVWLKRAIAVLGGRGGGRPELAQGGVAAAPEKILAFARDTLGGV